MHALPPRTVQLFRSCITKRHMCCWAQGSSFVMLCYSQMGYSRVPAYVLMKPTFQLFPCWTAGSFLATCKGTSLVSALMLSR